MTLDRRALLGLAAAAPALAAAAPPPDPREIVKLWPGLAPGARDPLPREFITDRVETSGFQDRYVTGVGTPLFTVFRPARANGAAALIMPGGGYIRVVIDKEGFEVAHRLAAEGVTSFVLRYRLPAEGWDHRADVPLQDAQRAMRLIRSRAREFGIDPKRIVAMGFSAGGHVAASLASRYETRVYAPIDAADELSARPDLSALMYPVILMSLPFAHAGSRLALLGQEPDFMDQGLYSLVLDLEQIPPPTFMVHAWDDASVPIENSQYYLSALREAKVSAEAHFFEDGGHGFGLQLARGKAVAIWPELFLTWARRHGWLA